MAVFFFFLEADEVEVEELTGQNEKCVCVCVLGRKIHTREIVLENSSTIY